MRKFAFTLAAAASALAVAAPAAAQYYPQPQQQQPYNYGGQPYGGQTYGQPYGNAYGYQNNWGQLRSLQVRIDGIQRQIRELDRRNLIRGRQADQLRAQSRTIEQRLRQVGRNGLNPYEASAIERRIASLEQQVRYAAGNRRDGRGYGNGYGYNDNGQGHYGDRDRDHNEDRAGQWDDRDD